MNKDYEAREYEEIKRNLLTTINLCAPTGEIQKRFVDILHKSELSGDRRQETIILLVGKLYDGLLYGNW